MREGVAQFNHTPPFDNKLKVIVLVLKWVMLYLNHAL